MMRWLIVPCFVAAAFLSGCEKSDTAAPDDFHDEPLGWTFIVPPGWEEEDEAVGNAARERGRKIIEDALNVNVVGESWTVLALRSDDIHKFGAEAEFYDPLVYGPYVDHQQELLLAYREGIDYELAKHGNVLRHQEEEVLIDGIRFATVTSEILGDDGKTVLFTAVVFDGLIGEFGFMMTYTCQLEPRCGEIRGAIMNSKFDKR